MVGYRCGLGCGEVVTTEWRRWGALRRDTHSGRGFSGQRPPVPLLRKRLVLFSFPEAPSPACFGRRMSRTPPSTARRPSSPSPVSHSGDGTAALLLTSASEAEVTYVSARTMCCI